MFPRKCAAISRCSGCNSPKSECRKAVMSVGNVTAIMEQEAGDQKLTQKKRLTPHST